MSIKDKLDYLQDTKQAIKTAIQGKGQAVSDSDTFRSYADKINAITTGGGGETDETLKELVEGTLTELNDTAGSITKVGAYAFYSKANLTKINLPNCSRIYSSGFYNCYNLSNIYLPNLNGCGVYAFAYVGSSVNTGFTIDLPNFTNNGQYMSGQFRYCGAETINLPKLSFINGSGMFQGCSKLKNISMPLLNGFIGQGDHETAFANCIALEQVEFPSLLTTCSSMFISCTNLTSVSLPQCSSLAYGTFIGCTKLTDLYAPNLTYLDGGVFSGCSKITSINLPLVSAIYNSVFYNCVQLQSVYAPLAQMVGSYAFYNCSSLQFMSLPKCRAISSYAFYNCKSLSAIYLQKRATLQNSVFVYTPMSLSSYLGYFGSIYVRSRYLSWYQTATNWAVYSNRMAAFTPTEDFLQENGGDIAGSTSLTMTLNGCEVGDNLIACVLTRSDTTTPDGWTLLATAPEIISSSSGTIQNMNIYTKVATSTTESITVTQAGTIRMYANIANIKNKTPSVINEFTNIHNTNTQKELTLTKSTENEILVFAQTIFAQTSGAFAVSGDYDDYYAYGDAGRLLMVQSTEEVGSQIIITHKSTGDVQWSTIGIELT